MNCTTFIHRCSPTPPKINCHQLFSLGYFFLFFFFSLFSLILFQDTTPTFSSRPSCLRLSLFEAHTTNAPSRLYSSVSLFRLLLFIFLSSLTKTLSLSTTTSCHCRCVPSIPSSHFWSFRRLCKTRLTPFSSSSPSHLSFSIFVVFCQFSSSPPSSIKGHLE